MHSVVTVTALPDSALDAAQDFSEKWIPRIRGQMSAGDDVTVVLPQAAYDHADWRRGLVRDLARAHSPKRVNFVAGRAGDALDQTVAFLADSPGITGQYLVVGNES